MSDGSGEPEELTTDEDQGGKVAEPGAGEAGPVTTPDLLDKTIAEMTGREFAQLVAWAGQRTPVQDAARAGVHVNSGPPGFENSGGHANFDPKSTFGGGRFDAARAGVHVNSGPPGFENSGGHANFDPKSTFRGGETLTLPDGGQVTLPSGPVDVHIRGFRIQR